MEGNERAQQVQTRLEARLDANTDFNRPIAKDVLPSSLRELHFGGYFNQSIEKDVLPLSLEVLYIDDKPIDLDTL
jgi:FNIP Repeat